MAIKESSIEKQIEDLNYQIKKIDRHTKLGNILNRFGGVLEMGIGVMCTYLGTQSDFPKDIFPYLAGSLFAIDGAGTLLTGKLHYVLFNLTKVHPKYKLEKLIKQNQQKNAN